MAGPAQAELHFMKKIPSGAEASNVLVGELDFLQQPLVAFVRLTPAVLLPGMTEVPIPTRSEGETRSLCLKKNPSNPPQMAPRFGAQGDNVGAARFSHATPHLPPFPAGF